LPYAPGLDGLRGLAVAAVVVFHAGPVGWLPGGFLGVSLFFTLSGYLIASLVLAEVAATGALDLGRFWVRRVRRLIPALVLLVVGVIVLSRVIELPARTRLELLGGLTYSSNWIQLAGGTSYAELFDEPSALTHLWSLAIEEQFYLVFPLVAWAVARRRPHRLAQALAAVSAFAVIGGVAAVRVVDDATWAYFATPARAPEIAIGVLLAVFVRASTRPSPPWLVGLGVAALAGSVGAWRLAAVTDPWVGGGGLAVFATVSAVLVAAAGRPGPLVRLLGVAPLRQLGRISYGLYLYHWPVVVLLSRPRVDLDPVPLFVARLALSLVLAVASFHLVEQPVRTGRFASGTRWARPRIGSGAGLTVARQLGMGLAVLVVAAALVVATVPGEPDDDVARPPAPAVVPPGATSPPREAGGPTVVLLLGDSVPNFLVRDGAQALDPTEVALVDGTIEGCDGAEGAPVGRAGTGVVTMVPPTCTGWRTQYPPLLRGTPPEVSVLMVGSGAVLDRQLDGEFRGPCSPEGGEWYRADVAERLRFLARGSDRVALVLPAWAEEWSGWVNPADHHERTDCVRAILTEEAVRASTPSRPVAVVDLGDHLCPDGPGRCRPVRQRDGVHIDPSAAPDVLGWVLAEATTPT
jgi:peptidoglycan/LPS O-acetylase OafA/YrhL